MPAILSANLNAIALLRNRRDLPWPSVVNLGRIALAAGAGGVTVHPRPDQRHIRFSDLGDLRALLDDEFPQAEFNIEGYPSDDFLALCEANAPDQVTLVPDDPAQATSDHGWQVEAQIQNLQVPVKRLKDNGFRVALFVDPDCPMSDLQAAHAMGVDRVELFTGPYGATYDSPSAAKAAVETLAATGARAADAGLAVNAGHDLTVDNLPALAAAIPNLAEVSIGHGLAAEALGHGMAGAVQRFVTALAPR
ncbi:MAG: pyridoxine 5'-phosphate synthase [Pseudomonadota bacterium]